MAFMEYTDMTRELINMPDVYEKQNWLGQGHAVFS